MPPRAPFDKRHYAKLFGVIAFLALIYVFVFEGVFGWSRFTTGLLLSGTAGLVVSLFPPKGKAKGQANDKSGS